MGMFDALDISASGMTAERLRMDVIAENLANAEHHPRRQRPAVPPPGGRPPGARRRASARCSAACRWPASSRIRRPPRRVYDPGHPDADKQGYVTLPNVNPVTEMVDLITSSRGYEANVTAMNAAKQMFSKTFDILR